MQVPNSDDDASKTSLTAYLQMTYDQIASAYATQQQDDKAKKNERLAYGLDGTRIERESSNIQ